MRNYDLQWARQRAGLTQSAAAQKLGCSRRTFNRWETGQVAMPPHKWNAFLTLCKIQPSQLPKPRRYDKEGYPVNFWLHHDHPYTAGEEAYETARSAGQTEEAALRASSQAEAAAYDAMEAALRLEEQDQYKARERERYRLLMTKHLSSEEAAKTMVGYDAAQYYHDAGEVAETHEEKIRMFAIGNELKNYGHVRTPEEFRLPKATAAAVKAGTVSDQARLEAAVEIRRLRDAAKLAGELAERAATDAAARGRLAEQEHAEARYQVLLEAINESSAEDLV